MKLKLQARGNLHEGVHYGFEYHMLNKQGEAITPPIQCKDFITDIFWTEQTGKPISIYGFSWKPGQLKKSEFYSVAVKYNNQDMKACLKPLRAFLRDWEERLGFPGSNVELDDTGTALIVTFSSKWTDKPILVSALTLFLRIGCQYDLGTELPVFLKKFGKQEKVWSSVDKTYLTSPGGQERIERMLNGDSAFKQKYDDFKEAYSIHGSSGIMCWRG